MKTKDIRALTAAEIEAKMLDLKEELFNLKFQAALGTLEKPARMTEIKRTIARMKTILTEGTYAQEKAEKKAAKKTTKKAAEATTEATEEKSEKKPAAKKTTAKKTSTKKAEASSDKE